jgi:hypothetical protein
MSGTATITTPTPTLEPTTFRLPKPGSGGDRFFGFSRAWYYNAEKNGWLRLIRIRAAGRERGVTLVPYQAVAEFVRAQMEAQDKEQLPF